MTRDALLSHHCNGERAGLAISFQFGLLKVIEERVKSLLLTLFDLRAEIVPNYWKFPLVRPPYKSPTCSPTRCGQLFCLFYCV